MRVPPETLDCSQPSILSYFNLIILKTLAKIGGSLKDMIIFCSYMNISMLNLTSVKITQLISQQVDHW